MIVLLIATLIITQFLYFSPTFAGKIATYSTPFSFNDKPHYRATARHIERGGIGYKHGYTTFESFLAPDPKSSTTTPFLDLRTHVFDDGKFAANVGVGLRKIEGCRIYGLNAYYDYRMTKKADYNQFGVGFETLGKRWDLRINGYLPVGNIVSAPYNPQFAQFSGNTMIVAQNYQFAMKGAQVEGGVHFGKSEHGEFYAAAGAYYFTNTIGPRVGGGKVRLTWKFKEYITLELSNSYDNYFHNRFQFQFGFTIPFGDESETRNPRACHGCDTSNILCSRAVQPVERQEIIVVGNSTVNEEAINPLTGEPYNFIFVENTSNSSGTYESPYHTLLQAQTYSRRGDIIYVFPGDGTTRGMNAGITLQNNQRFWGSGVEHILETTAGAITIPAQSTSFPSMTSADDGDAITLAAINEVSGFRISNAYNSSITGVNLEDIDISQCTIDGEGSLDDSIHIEYNGATGTAKLDHLTLTNSGDDAIHIESTSASTACTVSNCTIQNTTTFALQGVFAHQANVTLLNNVMQNNANGSFLTYNGPGTLTMSGNTITGTTSVSERPLDVIAATSPLTATINNNIISDNECGGLRFVLNSNSATELNINTNTITNNQTGSAATLGSPIVLFVNDDESSNCHAILSNNTLSNNSGAALYTHTSGAFNNLQIDATNNTITNNGGSGFAVATPCNILRLNATNNIISGGSDNGISTQNPITTADITISGNQIIGIDNVGGSNAIAIAHSGTTCNLVVTNNNLSNNTGTGISAYASIGNMTVDIENNTINNNQNLGSNASAGIDIEQYTTLLGSITNNTLQDNAGDNSVYIKTELTATPSSICLELRGNTNDANYFLQNDDEGTFNLTPCNVADLNTGTIVTGGTITTVQSCPGGAECPV